MKIFRLEQQVKEYKTTSKANTRSVATGSPAVAESDHIGLYARKFTVMNDYALPKAAFLVRRPVGVKSDDLNRWNSPEDSLRGLIVELYEELPSDLHGMLASHSSFRTTVRALHFTTFKPLTVSICSTLTNTMHFVAH